MRSRRLPAPNLTNQNCRDGVTKYLINHPEYKLLIIDNLSSLTPGLDENVKKDWDPVNQWLLDLRAKGIAVIQVHHTGKRGDQRGTSAREDNNDVSIVLKQPDGYSPEEGARFDVTFTKSREILGNSVKTFSIKLEKAIDGLLEWKIFDKKSIKKQQILSMTADGVSRKDIAKILKCTESYISQVIKQANTEGKIERNGGESSDNSEEPKNQETEKNN
jgi:putative DNA primase/helicase